MKTNNIKRFILIILTVLLVTTMVGCSQKQENTVEELEPKEEIEEVIDKEIDNIENIKTALDYLHFPEIDLEKMYTLEEVTVYLTKLFGYEKIAVENDYQCPFDVKDENKAIIAYAYATWLLTNISNENLTIADEKTCENVMALVLRFMGYSDRDGIQDFNKSDLEQKNAIKFANTIGIVFDTESGKVRGDYLLKLLWDILDKNCIDGEKVKDKLKATKLFSEIEYEDAQYLSRGEKIPVKQKNVQQKSEATQTQNDYSGDSGGTYSGGEDSGGTYSGGGDTGGGVSGGGGDTGGGDSGGGDTGGGTGGGDSGGGDTLPDMPID